MSQESLEAAKQWPDHGPTYRDWVDYVIRNSSHATQVLTPGGWSEWDAGRYARQQYEDMQRDKAATGEMLKKALLRCDELATRLATATELLRDAERCIKLGCGDVDVQARLAAFLEGCR